MEIRDARAIALKQAVSLWRDDKISWSQIENWADKFTNYIINGRFDNR